MPDTRDSKLPPSFAREFAKSFPSVWEAYETLGAACARSGPLKPQTQRLIKLALAMGDGSEGAVHSHVRRGLAEGIPKEEIRQVAVLAITTLGFPGAMAGLSWVEDILEGSGRKS